MALGLRKSRSPEPSSSNLETENAEFSRISDSAITERKTSESSDTELSSFQYSQNSGAGKETQRLCEKFHSWLQTEKRTKDETVARLAVEQFMLRARCRRKWEASGKSPEKFMEGLPDDCMKPPAFVRVCTKGQEALFDEDMPLKEVIAHFRRQLSAKTLTRGSVGPAFQASQNAPLETRPGREHEEDGGTNSSEMAHIKDYSPNPEEEKTSVLFIPEENGPRPEVAGVSCKNAHTPRRARPGMCGLHEEPQKSSIPQDVPMDVGQEFSSRPDLSSPEPVSHHHRNEGHSSKEFHVSVHVARRLQASCPEPVLNYNEVNPDQQVSTEEQHGSSPLSDKYSLEAAQNNIDKVNSPQDASMDGGSISSFTSDHSSPETLTAHHSNQGSPICHGPPQKRFSRFSKRHQCEECSRTYRYPSLSQAHRRRYRNERPFVCAECGKGFYQKSDLRVHQMIHKKEKPFTCSTCEMSFTHKTNLRAHERIHTGEKPYKCSFCQKNFRQSSTYYDHQKMHGKLGSHNAPSTSESSPVGTGTT